MAERPTVIIESSEGLDLHRMLTIEGPRGETVVVDVDALVQAFVRFRSDRKNEERFGWILGVGWWVDEFQKLERAAIRGGSDG